MENWQNSWSNMPIISDTPTQYSNANTNTSIHYLPSDFKDRAYQPLKIPSAIARAYVWRINEKRAHRQNGLA